MWQGQIIFQISQKLRFFLETGAVANNYILQTRQNIYLLIWIVLK